MNSAGGFQEFFNRTALASVFLSCCVAAYSRPLQPAPHSATTQGTISVETQLVVLPVRVTGPNGAFVSGLTADQFRVFEDGKPAAISFFRQEDTPVTVGMVVDHSRSMGPKLAAVSEAVSAFARSSNPDDEMFVVDFSDKVSFEMPGGKPFTNSPQELRQAVSAVSANGMTALYDAVAEALNHLQLGHPDKKALVIVSDGGDNASGRKYQDVLELARRSGAVIYAIALTGGAEEENPAALSRLCKDTGGLAFSPGNGQSVSDISEIIARDLREQYTLAFTPEATSGNSYRKLRVVVKASQRGKLFVRTRAGYYPTPQKSTTEITKGGS